MAFPADTLRLYDYLQEVLRAAAQVRQLCVTAHKASLASTLSYWDIRDNLLPVLVRSLAKFQEAASVPGLEAEAREQLRKPGLDLAVEFTAMVAAVEGTRDWLVTSLPKQNGYLQGESITANGATVPRLFSAAETATFRVQLEAVIAAIEGPPYP